MGPLPFSWIERTFAVDKNPPYDTGQFGFEAWDGMDLRNHPLISYRGLPSWPPEWLWLGDGIKRQPKGEAGVLKEVKVPVTQPFNRCVLFIEYKAALYMGCLLIDDLSFCSQVARLLQSHCDEPVEYIGGLDLSYSF